MKLKLFLIFGIFNFLQVSGITINGVSYTIISETNIEVSDFQCNTNFLVVPTNVTYQCVNYVVTSIGDYAFYNCTDLTSISLPNTVTTIGDSAFANCAGLTSIVIPDSVTFINDYAFQFCTDLTSITLSNSITSIGVGAFSSCSALNNITLPAQLTNIEGSLFEFCTGLTSVIIPNSVTTIGYGAFAFCSALNTVTIPTSVTFIDHFSFQFCTSLTTIFNFLPAPLAIDASVFEGVDQPNCMLYVPGGSQDLYDAAPVWQDFAPISTLQQDDFHRKSIQIYPNPAVDHLFIDQSEVHNINKILVSEITGKIVIEMNSFTGGGIDVSYLHAGIYVLTIQSGNEIVSEKFVKK